MSLTDAELDALFPERRLEDSRREWAEWRAAKRRAARAARAPAPAPTVKRSRRLAFVDVVVVFVVVFVVAAYVLLQLFNSH